MVGRKTELARVERLVLEAGAGRGGALVVRGEAGIGKSALLEHIRDRAVGMICVQTSGVESESELPFAGLGDVLRPLLGALGELTNVQADPVRTALGITPTRPVDRLTIGAATLSLLAASAPILVLVDDAHWLDAASQSALVFAARRLASDPVAMLFAAREGDAREFDAPGLDELRVAGLPRDEARVLLGNRVPSPQVADRLIEQTAGNPLALLELRTTSAPRNCSATSRWSSR